MITFFTIPRPFIGHFDVIQCNAIDSWLRLDPCPQIILLACKGEMGEVAREFSVEIYDVARIDGVPLVNEAISKAMALAKYSILAFVNADNIFLDDLMPVVKSVMMRLDKFVIIGRRWNLDLRESITFNDGWQDRLRADLVKRGVHHGTVGIDYLIFRGNLWPHMPPFLVGRDFYDNWMVREAVKGEIPVVDVTETVVMIHENHPVKPGVRNDEVEHNRRMAGLEQKWTIKNATWRFVNGELVRK